MNASGEITEKLIFFTFSEIENYNYTNLQCPNLSLRRSKSEEKNRILYIKTEAYVPIFMFSINYLIVIL